MRSMQRWEVLLVLTAASCSYPQLPEFAAAVDATAVDAAAPLTCVTAGTRPWPTYMATPSSTAQVPGRAPREHVRARRHHSYCLYRALR